jgi:hypothetical protein
MQKAGVAGEDNSHLPPLDDADFSNYHFYCNFRKLSQDISLALPEGGEI